MRAWDAKLTPHLHDRIAVIERHDGGVALGPHSGEQFDLDLMIGPVVALLAHVDRPDGEAVAEHHDDYLYGK